MRQRREAETHRLIGGILCLDFANTLNGHTNSSQHEYLHDCRDLVLWARHANAIPLAESRSLLELAEQNPSDAENAFQRTLAIRETIFRIFSALAFGKNPSEADLEQLNKVWQESHRHVQLISSRGSFSLGWDDAPSLEHISRLIVDSAIHLLTSENTKRIHRCAGDGCDWLFLDSSRNHLRRWCSMEECGNRAKMRRRQHRQKLAVSNY